MSFSILRRQLPRAPSSPSHPTFNPSSLRTSILPLTRYTSSSSSSSSATATTGGDLANPQSTSSTHQSIKASRATDNTSSPDTASVQTPVSDRSKIPGDQDEGTESHEQVKRDPKEPDEVKRERVESQGKKPLGVEDRE
ncbi:MAG: hypothetical protein Q9182_007174 [Xanthomendoza sp. 2 TL-2023]